MVTGDDLQPPQILSTMKTTSLLTKFTRLVNDLKQERSKLADRMAEIDSVLASTSSSNGHVRSQATRPQSPTNKQSLKSIVAEVVRRKPLDKQEILNQVLAKGYKFATAKPMGSLNAMLYSETGKKAFTNQEGKFSVR